MTEFLFPSVSAKAGADLRQRLPLALVAKLVPPTLAPLVVFEWLHNAWATAVADRQPGTFLHREWITIHANQQFDAFVA